MSFLSQRGLDPVAYVLQIGRLQQELQLKSRNAQEIQDELDDVRTTSMAEEATTLDKLQRRRSLLQTRVSGP